MNAIHLVLFNSKLFDLIEASIIMHNNLKIFVKFLVDLVIE